MDAKVGMRRHGWKATHATTLPCELDHRRSFVSNFFMLLLVCVAAAAKPGHDLEAPNFDGGVSIRVHYIRHGESFWNSGQAAARASGESEAAVKALGKTERFTDSPLSVKGVLQALSLRGRLFNTSAPLDSSTGDDLESLVRRAKAKQCTPPVLYTSNLRRAIDTALLGLKPLLESDEANRITIIPALQETCHYTDCNPLPPTVRVNELDSETSVLRGPLSTDVDVGSVNFTEAAEAPGYATTADERVRRILQLQGMALDATSTRHSHATPMAHGSPSPLPTCVLLCFSHSSVQPARPTPTLFATRTSPPGWSLWTWTMGPCSPCTSRCMPERSPCMKTSVGSRMASS